MSVITIKANVESGVISVVGWRESEQAKRFLQKVKDYFSVPFNGFEIDLSRESGYIQRDYIYGVKKVAEWTKVDVDDSVDELLERFKKEYNERREQRIAELIEEERQKARLYRAQNGCLHCRSCYQIGDGDFKCSYSGDELNSKIADDYDQENSVHYCFAEKPMPTDNCKWLKDDYLLDRIKDKWNFPEEWGMWGY